MLRSFVLFAASMMSLPCAAAEWVPTMYPLRDGLIPALDVPAEVVVTNSQADAEKRIIHKYAFTKFESNYNAITQLMVDQAKVELAKNGRVVPGVAPKRLDIKVVYMAGMYKFMYWKCSLRFEASLGDGTVVTKTVPHASGNPIQDLNGCVAESVMMLLRDEQVRAYLAGPVATNADAAAATPAAAAAAVPASVSN